MTVNTFVDKIISPVIPSQFPSFYEEQGPNFIEFVQEYYRWLEQNSNTYVGSTTYQSRSLLENFDVDVTAQRFIKYFAHAYLCNFPQNLAVDHSFIIKHILDFYRAKGSKRSIEILFRILYNLDAKVNIPGKQMFRTSNGTWKIPVYLETTDSPYLNQLAGKLVRGSSGGTAVVESVNMKIVNGRTINILYIILISGTFNHGDFVFCDAIPEMVDEKAPFIIGSLTAISVDGGGANFRVGDRLIVQGSGIDGIARVASVISENGKVTFKLEEGGYGYSVDASITINNSGTGGVGASFDIGSITDVQNISLNTDQIGGLLSTKLDISTSGMTIVISNIAGGPFTDAERVIGYAWTRPIQVNTVSAINGYIANGESLSNTSLAVSNVIVYQSDGQTLYCTGTDSALGNANLAPGAILVSNVTQAVVQVVSTIQPVTNTFANGYVIGAGSNSTFLSLHRVDGDDIGYYVPGMQITGNSSGATAIVVNQTRLTDWQYFPVAALGSNLDTSFMGSLTNINKQIGRIAYLNNQNPGEGYASAPTISILEPLIYDLRIPDGLGGYWGGDAVVSANAGSANGIVTSVSVVDSGLGYQVNEPLILTNEDNFTAVYGKSILLTSGSAEGYWLDTQGFLSDNIVLQDSYYYQVFSYEIETEKMIDIYRDLVKELAHPIGYALFGKFAVKREFANVGGRLVLSGIYKKPPEIPLTADLTLFKADHIFISADEVGYYITGSYEIQIEDRDSIMDESNNFILTDGTYIQSNT